MGGGDLNLKKSWHPTTMKNMERVWKAEQKHEAEQKKIEELQKELAEERAREEIRHFAEDQGVVKKKSERLDWMYEGVSALANKEEYLLGRAVDKTFEVIQQAESGTGNKPEDDALPESIFKSSTGNVTVDLENKIREDPLLMIRKQEDENRKKLLDNPIRMKQLADLLKGMHSNKKSKKSKKHSKKKRKHKHTSSKRKDSSDDSSDDKRKHRKNILENGHHKARHISSHTSEQKLLPYNDRSSRQRMKNHGLHSTAKPNETLPVKSKHANYSSESRKKNRLMRSHSDSSSENDKKRSRHRHRRDESTGSSCEDERMHRKASHCYESRRDERDEQKSYSELNHRKATHNHYAKSSMERQNSPRLPARKRKQNSSSESTSSSDSSDDRNHISQNSPSVISSRKQYGLIIRSNNNRDRNSRSRSPIKPVEKVTKRRSSSPDSKHQKNPRNSDARAKPSLKRPLETRSFKPEKSSKKLDETEKQRRLQEMMENAKERDVQRSANLKQHREEEKREALLQIKTAGTDFITPMLNKVADIGTVAERIKSNIYNIQRTKADLNKNFAKR